MEITVELVQPIAERAITILQRNVNIMDAGGIICGSGERERIGTFHEGAARVIRTGRRLEIAPEDAARLSGVRPGVNLPIRLGDTVVGVVGITGLPGEVRPFGELIREMVQLMLEQARTAQVAQAAALAREALLREVLTGSQPLSDRLLREADLLGLDLGRSHQVLICEPGPGQESGQYHRFEALAERAAAALRAVGANPVFAAGPWDGRLILVIGSATDDATRALATAVGPATLVATGLTLQGLHGLRRSYRTALAAMAVGKLLSAPQGFAAEQFHLETLLSTLHREEALAFIDRITGGLPPESSPNGRTLRQTAEAYLAAGMSRTAAAAALGIHRHTLIARLDQVTAATGLDPRTWDGGLRLYLALRLERLFRQNVDSP